MTNQLIQDLINQKNWDGLYKFINENEILLEDLNCNYNYIYDNDKYDSSSRNIINGKVKQDSLFSIIVHYEQIDLVRLVLSKGVNLNPVDSIHPLEMLFQNMHFMGGNICYKYSNLSDIRLTLIEAILKHAENSNPKIKLELDKSPFGRDPIPLFNPNGFFRGLNRLPFLRHIGGSDSLGNYNRNSYLQIFCGGVDLKNDNKKQVLNIIKLFVKAGANISYLDRDGKLIFEYINDSSIFEELLSNMKIAQIKEFAELFRNKISNYTSSSISTHVDTNKFKKIANIISNFIVMKEEAIPAIESLYNVISSKNLEDKNKDTAKFITQYLTVNDVRSLNISFRKIAEANGYVKKILNEEEQSGFIQVNM